MGNPDLTPVKTNSGWMVFYPVTGSIGRGSVRFGSESEAIEWLNAEYPTVMQGQRDHAAGLSVDDNPYPMQADHEPRERIEWRQGWLIANSNAA